ncbi:copper resistance CopC family protein [Actinoplanes solisilvae]|uniref:copper resistance CopC family protein n=1 Tax=Actinoplanes solisilvae TaxID=2486853 RepID=UPI000FDA7A58|nr:copper resistance CopC family protein [Actinoplanes solisilvae]
MNKSTRLLVALAAMVAVLLPGAPALAHNALTEATPAKGATVKKAPTSVKLKFLQKLNPEYTTIKLTGAAAVTASAPKVEGAVGSITFEPLVNGSYTVAYSVVSTDGHTVKGSYKFTVADPTATASPSPTATATTAAPASAPAASVAAPADLASSSSAPDESSNTGLIVTIAAIVVALLAVGGFLFARRRKTT